MKRIVKLESLKFDESLYPRLETNWLTVYQYSQAMKAGSKFPPIFVGRFRGASYILDGWHRCRAKETNKEEYIEADIQRFKNKKAMFLEAVKRNVAHGRPLTSQEKARIIDKFAREFKMTKTQISSLVAIPIDKIERFELKTVTHSLTGERIYLKAPLERALKHNPKLLDNLKIEEIETAQKSLSVRRQLDIVNQLIALVDNKLLLISDKVLKAKVKYLVSKLGRLIR